MNHRTTVFLVSLLLFSGTEVTHADGVWQLPSRGAWQQASSWFGGIPNGVGDIASFDSFAPMTNSTIRLEEPVVVGSIQSVNPHEIKVLGIGPGELRFDAQESLEATLLTGLEAGRLELDTAVWLSKAGEYLGFKNLDGVVDAVDLNIVGIHWLTEDPRWSSGDFTADGIIDAADLNHLGRNWRTDVTSANAVVPEPTLTMLPLLVLLSISCRLCQAKIGNQ